MAGVGPKGSTGHPDGSTLVAKQVSVSLVAWKLMWLRRSDCVLIDFLNYSTDGIVPVSNKKI